jgi:uncharacterized membrane protein YoaK (UPF0700 family)
MRGESQRGDCGKEELMDIAGPGQVEMWLSFGLAFVGGYSDAAGFVLAKTFTGHVTGNLVLAAIAVAAHDWHAVLKHLSAIATFLAGIVLTALVVRPVRTWPSLPAILGIEAVLIGAASSALASDISHGVEAFVILVSLALGLQNGAFRHAGGIGVHTTYLTGMITSLISTETKRYASAVVAPSELTPDPKVGFLCGIWIVFVLGAGAGAAMVFHFKALGMLGAVLLLIPLALLAALS